MDQYQRNADMQDLAHATAHLMHGSSEGRFTITYAPGQMKKAEIEGVNFRYADIGETVDRYQPGNCKQGWNTTADGERFYFIPTAFRRPVGDPRQNCSIARAALNWRPNPETGEPVVAIVRLGPGGRFFGGYLLHSAAGCVAT